MLFRSDAETKNVSEKVVPNVASDTHTEPRREEVSKKGASGGKKSKSNHPKTGLPDVTEVGLHDTTVDDIGHEGGELERGPDLQRDCGK